MDRPEHLREPGRTIPAVRRATGIVLAMLDAAVRSRVRVHGEKNLPRGPVLFVSNHFTRSETFLLPWLLDRVAGRNVSSLAWHGLFRGTFGTYLEAIGARSTREPGIKERIVRELARGESDWLIYPEGEMVKNKSVWGGGKLQLHTPDQIGPAHTGAALMALQAARLRRDAGRGEPVRAVPVSVTYHPIRPGPNPLLRLAARLAGPLPERLEEELLVEGGILFARTDIDVVIGEPIDLESWIPEIPEADRIPHSLLERLTTRFMQSVYGMTVRNVDHLVATGLASMNRDAVSQEDLARALLMASREVASAEGGHWHPGVGPALLDSLAGVRSEGFESVLELAVREGVCARAGSTVLRHRDGFRPDSSYDRVRLRHGIEVLANEVAPDRMLVRTVEHWMRADREALRERTTATLERLDQEELAREGHAVERGPRWIPAETVRGVAVLAHGYLASPEEMLPLATRLAREGWSCYLVRMPGHGSSHEHLEGVHRQDWWRGFQRGLAIARGRHPGAPLVVGGFSTGSFLALRAAAELVQPPRGVFTINAPLKLGNRMSVFAPAVEGWNRFVKDLGVDALAVDSVANDSEFPLDNYARNPVHSLHQLERAAEDALGHLKGIHVPTLIVQGDHDPVVRPESGEILLRGIASSSKVLVSWPAHRHGIVRGEDSETLHERVAQWLSHL